MYDFFKDALDSRAGVTGNVHSGNIELTVICNDCNGFHMTVKEKNLIFLIVTFIDSIFPCPESTTISCIVKSIVIKTAAAATTLI